MGCTLKSASNFSIGLQEKEQKYGDAFSKFSRLVHVYNIDLSKNIATRCRIPLAIDQIESADPSS